MRARTTFVVLCVLAVASFAAPVSAEPPDHCRSPRAAVDSVFGWLAPETHNPSKATRCLDRTGRTVREARESALRIKSVYEARALRIDTTAISDEPGWTNPDDRRASLTPHPSLPEIVVEKQADGQWRWTRRSLDRIDELYEDSPLFRERGLVEKLPGTLRRKVFGLEAWQAIAVAMILAVGVLIRQVIRFLVKTRLAKLAEDRGATLVAQIAQVFATPGASLLVALLIRLTYPELGLPYGAALALSTVVSALVVFAVVLALYRLVDVFATHLSTRAALTASKLDDQLVPLVRKSLKVVIIAIGALVVLQNLDVNVASVLAGLGIGGLAVALAAKDTIANFFGSVMIFADRPFRIGDWVKVEDVEGQVEEVGFRSTRIRTLWDSVVTLPNARFMEAKIDNYGARRCRRVLATASLTYDTAPAKLQAFVEGVRAIVLANPRTLKDRYEIHLASFGPHSLDVMIHFYLEVDTWTDELAERHQVFLEILRLAEALGVRFAFPTRTLHVESLASQGARAAPTEPGDREKLAEIVRGFGPGGSRAQPEVQHVTETGFDPPLPSQGRS